MFGLDRPGADLSGAIEQAKVGVPNEDAPVMQIVPTPSATQAIAMSRIVLKGMT